MRRWLIVAPPGDTATAVRRCLSGWAAHGLIEPPWWWSTDATPEHVESLDGAEQALLPDALPGPLDDVRLLGMVALDDDDAAPPDFGSAFRARRALLAEVLPQGIRGERAPLRDAVVVAVARDQGGLQPAQLGLDRGAAIVVVPEDRAGPAEPNHLVGSDETIPGLAAMTLACIGDTWAGPDDDPLALVDRRLQPHMAMAEPVQVIRSFARFADAGYLVDHIAAQALAGNSELNPTAEDVDRIELRDDQLDTLADRYLAKHHDLLCYEPIVLSPPPEKRISILEAIKRFLRFMWKEFFRWLVSRSEDAIARRYDALAAWVEKRFVVDPNTRIARWHEPDSGPRRNPIEDLHPDTVEARDGPIERAWEDLLDLAISLADAGAMPQGITIAGVPTDRSHALRRRTQIVPDPEQARRSRFGEVDPPQLRRPCDPRAFEEYLDSLRTDASSDKTAPAEADDPSARFERWGEWRTRTLLWKVGERIAACEGKLQSDLEAAQVRQQQRADAASSNPQSEAGLPKTSPQARTGKSSAERREPKLRKKLFIVTAVATALAVVCFLLSENAVGLFASGAAVVAGFAWLLTMLCVLIFGGLSLRTIRREQEREQLARLEDEARVQLYPSLLRRVRRRYAEYVDWAEISGWFVHHPVTPGNPPSRPDDRSVAIEAPAALQLGVIPVDPQRLQLVARRTRNRLLRPGWLAEVVRDVIEGVAAQLAFEWSSSDPTQASASPFADSSQDPDRPRQRLLAAAREGRYRQAGRNHLLQRLIELVGQEDITTLFEGVAPGDEDEPLPPIPNWTEGPNGLESAAARVRPTVVRIDCTSPRGGAGGTGVVIGHGLVATNAHVIAGATNVSLLFHDGSRREASIESVAEGTDLALVRVDTADIAPIEVANPSALSPGVEVLALGYPDLLMGEPTLTWGIVAATERTIDTSEWGAVPMLQHDAPCGPGSSGSPICDLSGRLVGIESRGSGSRDYGYMQFAVPADAVRELLASTSDGADTVEAPTFLSPLELLLPSHPNPQHLVPIDDFFGQIAADDPTSFLQRHWRDGQVEADEVARVDKPIDFQPRTLADASNELELGKPVVLRSLRMDFAQVRPAHDLRYFEPSPQVEPHDAAGGDSSDLLA